MKNIRNFLYAAFLLLILPLASYAASSVGKLYTMDNATGGNHILVYDRLSDGSLTANGNAPTGGNGTGSGLGNQGGLVLSIDNNFLFAVNAGSNSISSFKISSGGLTLVDTKPSGGTLPVSVTEHNGRLFVLNAGNSSNPGNIIGFYVHSNGKLQEIRNTKRPLSNKTAGTAGAQIAFTGDGRQLVVTEKATSLILTYNLFRYIYPSSPVITQSVGNTPFGFAVGKRDRIFISNAQGGATGQSSVSSYQVMENAKLRTLSGAIPTGETAACWVALTPDERFAFVTNTGSGTISSYSVDFDGGIELADNDAGVSGTGSAPIDMIISPDSRFLYTLNSGNNRISVFAIEIDGSLSPTSTLTGITPGANGMVAR